LPARWRCLQKTPFGLTQPYKVRHGGAQGDSGGVGYFELMGIRRTEFHRGVLLSAAFPSDLTPGAPNASSICFHAPFDSTLLIPEISFSDDRRFFARSEEGLSRLLDVACHGCWAGGGAVNGQKLKVFKVVRSHRGLQLVRGSLDTLVGELHFQTEGLSLVGVPLLIGAPPATAHAKAVTRLKMILRGVVQLRPCYSLALRVVVLFALAILDSVYEVTPPEGQSLWEVQLWVDRVLTAALRLPRNIPKMYLRAPLSSGGFGSPHLLVRFQVCFFAGIFSCLGSRNDWVRRGSQWTLRQHATGGTDNPDAAVFADLCRLWDMEWFTVPSAQISSAPCLVNIHRPWTGGVVALVSDGSSPEGALGWGALVADAQGPLATMSAGIACDVGYSSAAEWAGKAAAVALAQQLRIPSAMWSWSIADNLGCCLGSDGGRPTHCQWVDEIRIWYAAAVSGTPLQDGFTPAAHCRPPPDPNCG
jgi:hypothetical protein